VDPVDNNQVGAKHITEGRYLTDDEAEAEVQKLNKLMQDGYRFRQIKDALGA
jgi:hypothetical protein